MEPWVSLLNLSGHIHISFNSSTFLKRLLDKFSIIKPSKRTWNIKHSIHNNLFKYTAFLFFFFCLVCLIFLNVMYHALRVVLEDLFYSIDSVLAWILLLLYYVNNSTEISNTSAVSLPPLQVSTRFLSCKL